MPLYTYKGYDLATGVSRKGKIEADSAKGARVKLKQRLKIIVSDLKEELPSQNKKNSFTLFQPRVQVADISVMTRQFATLISAHVPVDEALRAITNQVESPVLRNTMSAVKDFVSEGKGLGEAMANFPAVFNRLYVNMVRAGESSGNLGVVLERLADFQEYQIEMKGKVVSAMLYPVIMLAACLGIIVFLFLKVVPDLQKVFSSLKVALPWYTELLIDFSDFLQERWYFVLAGIAIVALAIQRWLVSESGKKRFDIWVLKMPVIGAVVMRLNISRFTRTLSTLLNSGVPIIESLNITRNIISNSEIAGVIEDAKLAVQEGKPLGLTIERSGKFPSLVTHMITTGEATGELENMLGHVANAYEAEVQRKIAGMISLITPLMIVLLFGIVVVVVLGLMLPMLSVMKQVR